MICLSQTSNLHGRVCAELAFVQFRLSMTAEAQNEARNENPKESIDR